mgnify:CR=1 FL=1
MQYGTEVATGLPIHGNASSFDIAPIFTKTFDSKKVRTSQLQIFDLESSVMSAEAAMLAALNRKGSRGSHQSRDYLELNNSINSSYLVKLNKNNSELDLSKKDIYPLNEEHQNIINKTIRVGDFNGHLL